VSQLTKLWKENMKTTSFTHSSSPHFSRRASLAATILAASALVFVRLGFAQVPHGSDPDNPEPWGATIVTNPANSAEASPYSFDEPYDYPAPSSDGDALAPAPEEPADTAPGSVFVPSPPVGLVEQYGHPPMNPNFPELMVPNTMGTPPGELEIPLR
jgi:hypothetical protein